MKLIEISLRLSNPAGPVLGRVPELERSLSPALTAELHHLVDRKAGTELTADELRVEYATVLSWTIGLVIGILTEFEMASAKTLRAAARPQPAASRLWPSEARGTSEYPRDNERL